ncbi:MAG: hypothetical protein U5K43_14785 [Halofilum sp. (in: g-proteobacteria)]|nr:hypothetical protein [Halofilum sp. (in: g-proteobacteria)]
MAAALLPALVAAAVPGAGAQRLPDPHRVTSQGPLDGLTFVGRFGPADGSDDRQDALHFRSGHFWSANCTPCGFRPSRYWVHRSTAGIHFRGRLRSAESGVFTFQGLVRDGRVEVSINWHKERWYWTIDRDFRFVGVLRDPPDEVATLGEARAAAESAARDGTGCDPRAS